MAAVPSIGRADSVEIRQAPEADATRALYERHSRQIFNYCMHQLGSREEAEDATQITFMNAFRAIQRGVVPELESAWLFKIANNVILTRRRSSSRRRRLETPGDLDAIQDILPSRQVDSDELMLLTEALAAMPAQQQKALLLREWQGLSYREIGDELGLTQGAVETLLFRARRTLANGLTAAPKAMKRGSRLRSGLDFGSALAAGKALLSGGAAVKVAVTAAAVATTAVAADTNAVRRHVRPEPKVPILAVESVAPAVPRPPAAAPLLVSRSPAAAMVSRGSARIAGAKPTIARGAQPRVADAAAPVAAFAISAHAPPQAVEAPADVEAAPVEQPAADPSPAVAVAHTDGEKSKHEERNATSTPQAITAVPRGDEKEKSKLKHDDGKGDAPPPAATSLILPASPNKPAEPAVVQPTPPVRKASKSYDATHSNRKSEERSALSAPMSTTTPDASAEQRPDATPALPAATAPALPATATPAIPTATTPPAAPASTVPAAPAATVADTGNAAGRDRDEDKGKGEDKGKDDDKGKGKADRGRRD